VRSRPEAGAGGRGRRRLLIAAVLSLAVGLAGELVELSPLVHLLCLAVTVAALAALALMAPLMAAGDPPVDPDAPHARPDPGAEV